MSKIMDIPWTKRQEADDMEFVDGYIARRSPVVAPETFGREPSPVTPCMSHDPEKFFSSNEAVQAECMAICGGCPIKTNCLSMAIEARVKDGVWGGRVFK